jgi:large subunit ribosomal protein L32e
MNKFLRRDTVRYSKLGKNRKKIQKWRKPKGRDTKTRLKRRGYPKSPSIGYKSPSSKLKVNLNIPLIHNETELNNTKSKIIILAKVGAKKKIDLIKKSQEKKIQIQNLNPIKEKK